MERSADDVYAPGSEMSKTEVARNPDGTFLSGVSGNPKGRPPSKRNQITNLKQDLEIAIRKNVSQKDIQKIVERMIDLAVNEGSVMAAKLILDKTISNAKDSEEVKQEGGGVRVIIENVTVGRQTETVDIEDGEYQDITEDSE